MDLSFSPEDNAFRDEVRAFIASELSPETRRRVEEGRALTKADVVDWQRTLNARGWATPSWPASAGGPGWTAVQRYIFMDELYAASAPEPLSFNVSMIGPVLIEYGNQDQKERFLKATANLDIWWAQGFSEPGAGSDLAALSTTAERDGDHYVVNGQKLWQGMAHRADWMFTLVRTDPAAPKKQGGISFLLIDLRSPGITIRPIITIDGRHEVNEVFLDDVRVPVADRIGEENQGWTYAKYLLSNERTGIARIGMTRRVLARVRDALGASGAEGRYGREADAIEAELKALEITQLRVLAAQAAGQTDPRSSILKIKGTELRQAASELLMRVIGPAGLEFVYEGEGEAPFEAASNYFTLRAASIYGGASEVQKNIIASSVLGL
ncbi:acyl-CoA dehydrogenase family protein [Brevundimonas vitis]|uniref:Acyl-CoA dehydrogenase family protein n=1 Tax=Brevundimonas vitisensis TaxID=2800818 RepID=A0ABX7BNG0_9CAUL|nr:acyl-CoA dehydrogenase family protein [Brevundimonas vitisensis]QQQ17881.1 acyl-CoA dehydrogenase family protein [Brevundimonas vitisensis]